jgi:hypothetical protein
MHHSYSRSMFNQDLFAVTAHGEFQFPKNDDSFTRSKRNSKKHQTEQKRLVHLQLKPAIIAPTTEPVGDQMNLSLRNNSPSKAHPSPAPITRLNLFEQSQIDATQTMLPQGIASLLHHTNSRAHLLKSPQSPHSLEPHTNHAHAHNSTSSISSALMPNFNTNVQQDVFPSRQKQVQSFISSGSYVIEGATPINSIVVAGMIS